MYSRHLSAAILPHMHNQMDIIAWDFVSYYYHPHLIQREEMKTVSSTKIFDDGTSKCRSVKLKTAEVDLGAVAYKLKFLKRYGLHFHYLNKTYSSQSDGFFAERAASLTKNSIILRQTLFIHQ